MRDSLLTDLFKINHIKCIKNFCLVFFILVTLQMIASDLYYVGRYILRFWQSIWFLFNFYLFICFFTKRPNLDMSFFNSSFSGFFKTMFMAWLPMQLSTLFIVYGLLNFWIHKRPLNRPGLYDKVFLCLYILYFCLFILLPLPVVFHVGLACRVIIVMEQVCICRNHAK